MELFHQVSFFVNHVLLTEGFSHFLSPFFSGNTLLLFFHVGKEICGK